MSVVFIRPKGSDSIGIVGLRGSLSVKCPTGWGFQDWLGMVGVG